jgi:hypothetical protein
MRYCGVVPAGRLLQLVMLEELREPEPPIRLDAAFFEPATAAQVAAEVRGLGEVVVAVGGPQVAGEGRVCDQSLRERGVTPEGFHAEIGHLFQQLHDLGIFAPADAPPDATEGPVADGAYSSAPVFETNADGVFCALQGRRLPARRHPLGIQMRIDELTQDQVLDGGGDLWHRRIEEIDAAAAALAAHRYAVGHACWVGDPVEGVIVLPGSRLPASFSGEGVVPAVPRQPLPPAP